MGDLGRIRVQIATIAGWQWGHITRKQLLELGVTARTIARWVADGKLIPVHAGVYAVGYRRPEPVAAAAAAVLACGRAALLSHQSAGALWGLGRWPQRPHVTVPGDRRPARINVHRCRTLTRADARRQLGVPVTSPARTILDNAPGLSDPRLARFYNDARLKCGLTEAQLREILDRLPYHPGAVRTRGIIQPAQAPTRSAFEDAFLRFAAEHGLPTPRVNARVAGYEVDALFEQEGVIVELDGYDFHQGKGSFEGDRERDTAMLALGLVTIRITWERLINRDAREAKRLKAILAERRGPRRRAS